MSNSFKCAVICAECYRLAQAIMEGPAVSWKDNIAKQAPSDALECAKEYARGMYIRMRTTAQQKAINGTQNEAQSSGQVSSSGSKGKAQVRNQGVGRA